MMNDFGYREYEVHPKTKLHYAHVINLNSQVFGEIATGYKEIPWVSVITDEDFLEANLDNRKIMYIIWRAANNLVEPPQQRKSTVAIFYCEPAGGLGDEMMVKCFENADNYDMLFVRSHKVFECFSSRFKDKISLAVTGYDAKEMGEPDFSVKKKYEIVFYGNYKAPRRKLVLDTLRSVIPLNVLQTPLLFREKRNKILNESKAILNPLQYSYWSFSNSRIWQAISSSAVMINETDDVFPAIPGEHCLCFPAMTAYSPRKLDIIELGEKIRVWLHDEELMRKISKQAWEDLSKYSPLFCMEEFFVPASDKWARH